MGDRSLRLLLTVAAAMLVVAGCGSTEEAPPVSVPVTGTTTPPETAPVTTEGAAPVTTEGAAPGGGAPSPTTTSSTTTVPLADLDLAVEEILTGFGQPVLVVPYPDAGQPGSLVVVDQPGRVWIVAGAAPEVLLDIRDRVRFSGEQGLLGAAFAPGFPDDPRMVVDYVGRDGNTRISEFRVDPDEHVADPASERVVLRIAQPAANHNGGMIAFGPDGDLWIGMGDGGAANDRFHNGQDPSTLLGAMLRIDVGPGAPEPYGIPQDNPFAGGAGGAPEVWATGLRNPWRWTFDGPDLWIADVGQDQVEEVDLVPDALDHPGVNFGWPVWEGDRCVAGPCDTEGFVAPVATYRHDEGCSIIGGAVYRGTAFPRLAGRFFFADFCSGRLWSVDAAGAVDEWTDRVGAIPGPTSVGTDGEGELLVTTTDGRVLRVTHG